MVRTRFAPSPTGYMHIGNLRAALYSYLIARRSDGQFILRLEDTDRKRNIAASVQVIYDSLRFAGLAYDEGPDKGGPYGPYVQSQRRDIYRQHAELLVQGGTAYRCFCTQGLLDKAMGTLEAPAGPDPCRHLPELEVSARLRGGEPHVIRQRIPEGGATSFVDRVYGTISVSNDTLEDQVLLKSDGYPTYNFANVVDDHLMQITHVVRGVEFLSSTPKYNLLYGAFGWPVPEYVHTPHIVKEGGKKLSKRAGDASFQDLLQRGYLPTAILNYIALLGWNPGDEREVFTLPELVEAFDIGRINRSSAAFSLPKLDWLNGEHLRRLAPEAFAAYARPFYPPEIADTLDTGKVSRLIQSRVAVLGEIPGMVGFLARVPEHPLSLYEHAKSRSTLASSLRVLQGVVGVLEATPVWTHEALAAALVAWGVAEGLKTGTVMWPLRIALTGTENTPGGATEIAEVLGQTETLRRVSAALVRLSEATH